MTAAETFPQQIVKIVVRNHVDGRDIVLNDFIVEKSVVNESDLPLNHSDVMLRLVFVSVDPYMVGRFKSGQGYAAAQFVPGEPVESLCVAKVVASKNESFVVGDLVSGVHMPWHTLFISRSATGLQKLPAVGGISPSNFLGVLGMPGMTAYGSLKKIACPRASDTAFVSAAAGAVGLLVGQLLKRVFELKCVVGSAGSDEKVAMLLREGFDFAFNYKTTSTKDALKKFCPDGIDIYYDNVGGETLDSALGHMRKFGRIVGCGMISQYQKAPVDVYGVKNLMNIVTKSIKFEGFICSDFWQEMFPSFIKDMPQWIQEGKVHPVEDCVKGGLEDAPSTFLALLKGDSVGKKILEVVHVKTN